jgi:succinate dehydrogenase / fumarate reductase membrane anchor subunit
VQVVIEDYVHTRWRERTLHVTSGALHLAAAAAGIFALVQIAMGVSA